VSTLTQAQLDQVAGLPSREAASILGVGKSTVNKYREAARINGGSLPLGTGTVNHKVLHVNDAADGTASSIETRSDGSLTVDTQGDVPQTKDQIDEAMRKRGFDPENYTFTYRFSEWQAQRAGGEIITMYAARAGASPKREVAHAAALDVTELLETVKSWDFTPVVRPTFSSVDAVLGFADPQLGKVDENGGTDDTVAQVMTSFQRFVDICIEEKPRHALFADLGDGLENFYNTSSQRETNDLDLTSQVRLLRRIQAEGLRMIRPHVGHLSHRSAPSNHGSVRIGPQAQASTASNDWGLEVSHQLQDVFEAAGSDIDFGRPEGAHELSLVIDMESGTTIGMAHGDQASQNQLATWWQRQAFGWENPLREAHILLYGHHHNHALEEVYEGRWLIGCASSDRGSAWFTNRTGRSATSGMTTFLTADGVFWDLQVI
jgi:hypothetical protein